MRRCPTCGDPLDGEHGESCPECGPGPTGSTEAFAAVPARIEGAHLAEEAREHAAGPVLVVRKGPEVGERFVIDRDSLTIGRDPASDIFLNDVTVSRDHATLTASSAEVSIEDSGSLNGTYVNGVRVDSAILADGDVVQIGTFQMVYMGGARS